MNTDSRTRVLEPRLLAAVFLSGAAGLVYQVVWARMLSNVLGSTTGAVCSVLSIFMLGLAAGGWWFGRLADRIPAPMRCYALLEAGLGAYCLLMPWLLGHAGPVLAVLALLPPTAAMGATLPVMAGHCARSGRSPAGGVSWAYALNTLGGAAGAALAGFAMIPGLGLSATVRCAVLLNLCAAALAWAAAAILPVRPAETAPEAPPMRRDEGAEAPRALWPVFALSGMAALAYEVLWTRLLALVLGSSAHAFALILVSFLAGLALGARLMAGRLREGRWPAGVTGALQLAVAGATLLLLAAYRHLPYVYLRLYDLLGSRYELFSAALFCAAFLFLLPATTLMGMSFPWFSRIVESWEKAGERTGALYAVNTLGSAAGPWAAGFLLVPWLGLSNAVAAAALANVGLGLWALCFETDRRFRLAAVPAAAVLLGLWLAVPAVPADILHSGVSVYAGTISRKGAADRAHWRMFLDRRRRLYSRDGVHASVSVWEQAEGGRGWRTLDIDGKADASDSPADMPTQLLLGHLPMLLADEAPSGRALLVGMGSGVTLSALARHPQGAIDVVELEPAVTEAAAFFDRVNGGAFLDPRVRVHHGDARHFLQLSKETYGVIVAQPSNLYVSGMSHLFTEEYYSLVRSRLAPGGVFCQWLHLYGVPREAVLAGLRAMQSRFPHVTVWAQGADLLLVASDRPVEPSWQRIQARLDTVPGLRQDLAPWGLAEPSALLSRWVAGEKGAAALAASSPGSHTDDRPTLEYLAQRTQRDALAGPTNSKALDAGGEALSACPGMASRAPELARAFLLSGRPLAARREFAFVSPQDAWRDGLQRDLGELFLRQGASGEALEVFRARASDRKRDPAAWLDLARAQLAGGEREAALGSLERFAALAGPDERVQGAVRKARQAAAPGPTYLAMALGYARLREGGNAAQAFSKVMELDPGLLDSVTGRDGTIVR